MVEGEAHQFGEGIGRRGWKSTLVYVQAMCCNMIVVSFCQRGCDPEKMIQNMTGYINLEEPIFPGRTAASPSHMDAAGIICCL